MCGITIGGDVSIQISGPSTPTDGSITAAKIGSENAGDGQVLTADGNGGAAWEAPAGGGPGYLEYVALLSQSGTAAPVATVLKNTLGGTVVWTRNGVGSYTGILSNAFPAGKTLIIPTSNWDIENQTVALLYTQSGGIIVVTTYDASGFPSTTNPTDNAYLPGIEIRVYP